MKGESGTFSSKHQKKKGGLWNFHFLPIRTNGTFRKKNGTFHLNKWKGNGTFISPVGNKWKFKGKKWNFLIETSRIKRGWNFQEKSGTFSSNYQKWKGNGTFIYYWKQMKLSGKSGTFLSKYQEWKGNGIFISYLESNGSLR